MNKINFIQKLAHTTYKSFSNKKMDLRGKLYELGRQVISDPVHKTIRSEFVKLPIYVKRQALPSSNTCLELALPLLLTRAPTKPSALSIKFIFKSEEYPSVDCIKSIGKGLFVAQSKDGCLYLMKADESEGLIECEKRKMGNRELTYNRLDNGLLVIGSDDGLIYMMRADEKKGLTEHSTIKIEGAILAIEPLTDDLIVVASENGYIYLIMLDENERLIVRDRKGPSLKPSNYTKFENLGGGFFLVKSKGQVELKGQSVPVTYMMKADIKHGLTVCLEDQTPSGYTRPCALGNGLFAVGVDDYHNIIIKRGNINPNLITLFKAEEQNLKIVDKYVTGKIGIQTFLSFDNGLFLAILGTGNDHYSVKNGEFSTLIRCGSILCLMKADEKLGLLEVDRYQPEHEFLTACSLGNGFFVVGAGDNYIYLMRADEKTGLIECGKYCVFENEGGLRKYFYLFNTPFPLGDDLFGITGEFCSYETNRSLDRGRHTTFVMKANLSEFTKEGRDE